MAKPMSIVYADSAGPSSSAGSTSTRPVPLKSSSLRRRKASGSKSRPLAPSSTLLSLLATVASSSVAEGSPAPPDFLCPSIESTPAPTHTKTRRSIATTSAINRSRSPQSRAVVQNIPHRFEQGEDGVWRRIEVYTLYGICPNCASALDGQISRSNITAMPNNNLSKHEPPDNLPPGWSPVQKPSAHTTLILAMSLVLAFFICFLIIGCLFWRKSLRRRYNEKDLEKKGRRRSRRSDVEDLIAEEEQVEKESRTKQKVWARATARWMANARHSTRLRRSKRLPSLRGQQSSTSLDNPRENFASRGSSPCPTPTHSRSLSRRSSSASFHQEPSTSNSDDPSPVNSVPIPTIELSAPEPSANPPAYQQRFDTPQTGSSDAVYGLESRTSTTSLLSRSRRPSHSSTGLSTFGDSFESPAAGLTAAHVATDDKTVLARLAELASAPPPSQSSSAEVSVQVSAPEWRDEEMEDFIALESAPSDVGSTSPSPFPPPPSKGNLLAPNFYEYPYAFEDLSAMEPEYGPSAPPFEETPNAPSVDESEMTLLPSAPPLIDDDDFYVPDSVSSLVPADLPSSQGADQDHNGLGSSDPSGIPAQELVAGTPSAVTPARGEDETRGILPVYRP